MTKKQLDKYNRYRIFLRAKLGCFHANEQELQIYENGDRCQKAFYHFIRFIQYLAMGEVQKAYDNIKEAEALSNGDIDKVLRSQILMDVIFCVRILYIVDSINKIIDHIDDFDLSPLAREWFAGFGKIGGDVIHLVIGLLIGFDNAVSLKECLLLDEANRIVDNYEWMNFPEFGLEIDVQNTDVIFFHPGQHPLENEKIKKCIFETVIELDKFSVEQQSALQEVCKIITENMVSESPTIDELKAAFNSVMLPKTII